MHAGQAPVDRYAEAHDRFALNAIRRRLVRSALSFSIGDFGLAALIPPDDRRWSKAKADCCCCCTATHRAVGLSTAFDCICCFYLIGDSCCGQ